MAKSQILIPIPKQEHDEFKELFELRGVKQNFLDRFKSVKRSTLADALKNGKCQMDLLQYMRRYKNDNPHLLQSHAAQTSAS